jgi:hypothetical protein
MSLMASPRPDYCTTNRPTTPWHKTDVRNRRIKNTAHFFDGTGTTHFYVLRARVVQVARTHKEHALEGHLQSSVVVIGITTLLNIHPWQNNT